MNIENRTKHPSLGKMINYINFMIVVICFFAVLDKGIKTPYYNWDIIGYVAAAYKSDGNNEKELTRRVFEDLSGEISSDMFLYLTGSMPYNKYRSTTYKDPSSLEEQIPFYSIRTMYLLAMKAFNYLGFSYSSSTYLVSAFFASFSVLLISGILFHQKIPQIFLPLIVIFSGIADLSRYSTPDSTACFIALAFIFFYLRKNPLALAFATLLPLARTDFVLFSLLAALAGFNSLSKLWSIISFITSLILYFAINKINGNYGFLTIFNFTLIGIDPYPASMALSTNLIDYIKAYAHGASDFLGHPHLLVYCMGFAFFYRDFMVRKKFNYLCLISAASLAFVILHLVIFPAYMDRFFSFPVSIILIYIIKQSLFNDAPNTTLYQTRESKQQPHQLQR